MPRSQESLARLIDKEGLSDPRISAAFRAIDRADFVPPEVRDEAYLDRPVPLPCKQTTSQPSLIARMVDAAAVSDGDRVLEVGTGYGFQTALLARLGAQVVSVERFSVLADAARANLTRTGIDGAEVVVGNGWEGASDRGPFQAIVVSAAASEVPPALGDQLAEGGRMVIPVKSGRSDDVILYEKKEGTLKHVRVITPARFVPLVKGPPE